MKILPPIPKAWGKLGSLLLEKAHNLLTPLIFVFASFQLGLHFWPPSSFLYGVRVDYLSPTLYLLDILLILHLAVRRSNLVGNPTRLDLAGIVAPLALVNIFFSLSPLITLIWWSRLFLYSSFIFSLEFRTLQFILLLTMAFQVALAAIQVYLGHSLQGPLYWLGERMVSVGTPNVATVSLWGREVLRAYGTFSHPNILAGYSVICLLIIQKIKPSRVTVSLCYCVTATIILLTNSRSAALAFLVYIGINLPKRFNGYLIAISILLLFSIPVVARDNLSITDRFKLQTVSLKVIEQFPIFGTGAQASISTYPSISPSLRLLQPDHNSFTLLLSWVGIFGVVVLLFTMRSTIGHFIPLLPLLLLDHYLLTSPQGLFILLLYLKVVNYSHVQKNRQ